jgi:pilus assembly protein FimV
MMKRKPALFMTLSLCGTPLAADALGLGDIELFSSLNQPLDARIELKAWQENELEIIKVDLGSKEQFERAGLERPSALSKLDFAVVEEQDRAAYIKVSSKEPFKEPFLDFLVDVSWPQGHVLREYTLLLDPPLYGAAVSREAQRNVVQQGAADADSGSNRAQFSRSARTSASGQLDRFGEAAQATQGRGVDSSPTGRETRSVSTSPNGHDGPANYGPTQAGDNLWSVATQLQAESSAGTNQMMLALFQNNPHAFSKQNMNLLKKGVVLQIPDRDQVASISQAQALAEIKHHHALWQEYRQSIAETTGKAPAGTIPGESEATDRAAASDVAEAASEGRVKLLSAGAGTAGAGGRSDPGNDAKALRQELTLALEDAEAKQNENVELRDRVAEAETLIQDLQRLVNLKDDTIAALQSQLADAGAGAGDVSVATAPEVPDSRVAITKTEDGLSSQGSDKPAGASDIEVGATDGAMAPEDTVAAPELPSDQANKIEENGASKTDVDHAVTADSPAAAAPTEPQQASPEIVSEDKGQSFLTWIREGASVDPALFGIGLGGLLMLGSGVGLWRRRRASEPALAVPGMDDYSVAAEEPAQDVSARAEEGAEVAEEPVSSQERRDQRAQLPEDEAHSIAAHFHKEEAIDEDPLAEVNVYLAYERFDQAEQLIKEALEKYPHRHEYKVKLLETYAAANKPTAFQGYAQTVRDEVGEHNPFMEKVMQWWQELAPDQALFPDTMEEVERGQEAQFDETRQETSGTPEVDTAVALATDTLRLDDADVSSPEQERTVDKELDWDLGAWEEDKPAADSEGTEEGTLDFDLGFETDTLGEQQGQRKGAPLDFALADEPDTEQDGTKEGAVDFDLGSLTGAQEAARSLMREQDPEAPGSHTAADIDFDLGASIEDMQARAERLSEQEPTVDEGTIDFDLGFSSDGSTAKTERPALESRTAHEPSSTPQSEDEATQDEGTLDFDLGFSTDGTIAHTESEAATSETGPQSSTIVTGAQGDSLADDPQTHDEAMSLDFEPSPAQGQEEATQEAKTVAAAEGPEAIEGIEERDDTGQPGAVPEDWPEHRTMDAAEALFELDSEDQAPAAATSHGGPATGDDETLMVDKDFPEDLDEVQTKLDLAQAYMEMGDAEGARSILNEVLAEGDEAHKQVAQELLSKLA